MTLSYYDVADSYVAKIRRWYYNTYHIVITKKHAVLLAIANVKTVSTNILPKRILRTPALKTRSVSVEMANKAIVNRVRKVSFKLGIPSRAYTVSTLIMVYAVSLPEIKKDSTIKLIGTVFDDKLLDDAKDYESRSVFDNILL